MNDIVNHHQDQLTKSAKFISRDSKLFIMATTKTMRSYLLLEMSLHIKSTFVFFLAIEVFKSLIRINQNFMCDFNTAYRHIATMGFFLIIYFTTVVSVGL